MPVEKTSQNRVITGFFNYAVLMIVLILLLVGCGGKGGADNPVAPDMDGEGDLPELAVGQDVMSDGEGNKAIWGYWDLFFTPESGFEVVPLRGVEYTLNVNIFLQPPAGDVANLAISIVDMEKLWIAGDITVDVSLTHPFPALTQFTGFDVMGVFIGTGSYTLNSDTGCIYGNPKVDAVLKNADGYTRWMNQMEFTSEGLRGYTDGKRGIPGQFWGSTLNGYKYYASNLHQTQSVTNFYTSGVNVSRRGMFSTNSTNTRRYEVHFPRHYETIDARFQYAVIASWFEPDVIPPENLPGDFPAEANMQEPFYCEITTVGSTLYWNDMYDNGGNLLLTLEVFDWGEAVNPSGVAGEIKKIVLDSPDEFINHGNKMVFYPGDWTAVPGLTNKSVGIALDVGAVNPGGPCPYDNDVMITLVTAELGNYDNGLGGAWPTQAVLAGYARLFYDFGNVCNDPPVIWFDNCPEDGEIGVGNKTFRWDGYDDVTPNNDIEYRWKLDSGLWSDWEADCKQTYLENLVEQSYTIYVEARDSDGQVSAIQCDFYVDLPPEPAPPNVGFNNCTSYVTSPTNTWHLDLSDDFTPISSLKVRYTFDGGPWVNLPDGTTQITLNGLVSGGPYQLLVEVEDLDTMISQALCDFEVNFAPSVSIDNCPGLDINLNNYTLNWTGTDPELDVLEYQTKLNTAPWSAWGPANSINLVGLPSGTNTILVKVRDPFAGEDQASCNINVNFGPSISIDNKPTQDVNTNSYTFNWTASDDLDSPLTLEYNVELDGVWQGWTTGISGYTWTPLSPGPRTFRVRVRDSGNPMLTDEDVTNFVVNYKPAVTLDNCPAGIWASTSITFDWTGIDDNTPEAGMEYSWKLDSDPWSAWSLGQLTASYIGLSNSAHTFEVKVRDTGSPQLYCDTAPSTCDTCNFTVDTSCSIPPAVVQNFVASDGDEGLNGREVELTWDGIAGCVDTYDIEKQTWDWPTSTWVWTPVISVPDPTTSFIDTDARYSGPDNAIQYRIVATNIAGSSPGWSTDSGYPPTRKIHMSMWCTADDVGGTNASTTWARASADFADCNLFWLRYGVEYVLENAGAFFYIGDIALKDLTGGEDGTMHSTYGRPTYPNHINVYFVSTSNGNPGRGYCRCLCPGTSHNTNNVFIVLCRDTRGTAPNICHQVLPHECGHGVLRYWDQYLLDTNGNLILDDGTTCAANNTWCTTAPSIPPLFCDDNSSYPENPGAFGKVPKQLMWYTFPGAICADYDISAPQWQWNDDWLSNNEVNYPWP